MASCEDARLQKRNIEPIKDIQYETNNHHNHKITTNGENFLGRKQIDFNFGAEIIKTSKMPTTTNENEEIKTNFETITTAETEEIYTKTINIKELPPELENSYNVPTDQVNTETTNDGDQKVVVVSNNNDDNDDDEEDDSFETDDENENDKLKQSEAKDGINDGEQQHTDNLSQEESDDDDDSTSDSDFSDLSGLSDVSGREWKPLSARPINWVQKQIHSGANPRELLSQMLPSSAQHIAPGLNDMTLWRILASMLSEPPRRQKLRYINTFNDVIQLIQRSENIIVLTGAGVSVSCGIPDFRSSDGIYSRLAKDYPDLPDPQAMFDINYFSRDPRPFYKFAREIYPGQFKPSPCHSFIKLLEQKQKLLRNYTQNIDTLEQVAGIRNVIECHGSFSSASCTKCKFKCDADAIRPDIFAQRIPVCPRCQPNVQQSVDASEPVSETDLKQLVENGIMKPDIVFFGEGLPEEFHTVMARDKDNCDLLIVIGSSLKVRPVALIPSSIPANVPQILINREQLHHLEFDVELLGDSDVIINQICHCLGDNWQEICYSNEVLKESKELLSLEETCSIECEEDVQQMQDTDTQSVKSSASTDIAFRSAGAYSDSGFESSTSSGMALGKDIIGQSEANKAIEKIKTSILELNNPLTKTKTVDILPQDLLEEPMESVDYSNPNFHPFVERLGQNAAAAYGENYRHLSIDSSKDSGIQCDSSNSAMASSSVGGVLPPLKEIPDNGVTDCTSSNTQNGIATTSSTSTAQTSTCNDNDVIKTNLKDIERKNQNLSSTNSLDGNNEQKRRQLKRSSIAERLHDGTYYYHESSSSYVFPGAQVSWCSDTEEEIDDDDDEEEDVINDYIDDDDDENDGNIDGNPAPLSPFLTPSIEAEMVNEITTTKVIATTSISTSHASSTITAFNTCNKRRTSNDIVTVSVATVNSNLTSSTCLNALNQENTTKTIDKTNNDDNNVQSITTNTTSISSSRICSPPPIKKRRNSCNGTEITEVLPSLTIDKEEDEAEIATITTTVASVSSDNTITSIASTAKLTSIKIMPTADVPQQL